MQLVYTGTDKPVQVGDVVHLLNRPYYIRWIAAHEECVGLVSMDERKLNREVPAWKIRAYVD